MMKIILRKIESYENKKFWPKGDCPWRTDAAA